VSVAQDVNASSAVVGKIFTSAIALPEGFVYDPVAGQVLNLNQPPFSPPFVVRDAVAINGSGQIAGMRDRGGFVMMPSKQFIDLGMGPPGAIALYVTDINDLGDVTGYFNYPPPGSASGFIYHSGSWTVFSDPSGSLAPTAINNTGQIVGSGTNGAFLYQNGILQTISGVSQGEAKDINNAGLIVGDGLFGTGYTTAWISDNGMPAVNLNTLIDPKAGWFLAFANGINNFGQIVGTGTYQGQQIPYLLTPTLIVNPGKIGDKLRYYISLLGAMAGQDAGGWGIDPSGHPVPVPPMGPDWPNIPAEERDVLIGLAVSELAALAGDVRRRQQLRDAALGLLSAGAATLARSASHPAEVSEHVATAVSAGWPSGSSGPSNP
jgi:hypothetical protein